MSRSIRRRLFSRRSCASSSRSLVVSAPAGPRPASISACRTHRRSAVSVRSSSRAIAPILFPLSRTNRTVSALNSSENARRLRFFPIGHSYRTFVRFEVSTKPGEGHRRKGTITTRRNRDARPAPDLVDRDFTAAGPDHLWVADITYIPTWAGFLYLAVVLDAWSRRIVGWAMATHLRTELVLDALNMAVTQRRPAAVVHHSDQGCQYTSLAFGLRCREAGVRPSMGSVGDAFDNAMCESFFATLECELLDRRRFKSQVEARMAVFEFIEGWYNPRRRHSALEYESPISYERKHLSDAAA